jgi:hypothetical protein
MGAGPSGPASSLSGAVPTIGDTLPSRFRTEAISRRDRRLAVRRGLRCAPSVPAHSPAASPTSIARSVRSSSQSISSSAKARLSG